MVHPVSRFDNYSKSPIEYEPPEPKVITSPDSSIVATGRAAATEMAMVRPANNLLKCILDKTSRAKKFLIGNYEVLGLMVVLCLWQRL